jgi:hypothetical protein
LEQLLLERRIGVYLYKSDEVVEVAGKNAVDGLCKVGGGCALCKEAIL